VIERESVFKRGENTIKIVSKREPVYISPEIREIITEIFISDEYYLNDELVFRNHDRLAHPADVAIEVIERLKARGVKFADRFAI
jgi:hypothetical protein